ncbi:unnamed protein product [Dracunculus medinensis]|uniref:RNase H domain-containing protein n=1 Tax=Dracunculus medinensis TaxID=318479 RepID=A0A0N4U0K6_DRAME|nr:unnamed protein product [Dracunculus medinensis]
MDTYGIPLQEIRIPHFGFHVITKAGSRQSLYRYGVSNNSGRNGVGIVMSEKGRSALIEWKPVNDRMVDEYLFQMKECLQKPATLHKSRRCTNQISETTVQLSEKAAKVRISRDPGCFKGLQRQQHSEIEITIGATWP